MSGPTSKVKLLRQPHIVTDTVYINLGRTGDAIASVPLCYLHLEETSRKCALMVARPFSSFLEGISYVIPEIWDGDFKDVAGAKAYCQRRGYRNIKVAQIYGYGLKTGRKTSSFLTESWEQVGKLEHWDKVPLIFDQRNTAREADLVNRISWDRPVILVATSGHSAPVPFSKDLFHLLHHYFSHRALVVDLAAFNVSHFHDFLGLFDRAACLVTGDTAFGQLACASRVPVCALVACKPTHWHSSARRRQHLCHIRYDEYEIKKDELVKAIETCLPYHESNIGRPLV